MTEYEKAIDKVNNSAFVGILGICIIIAGFCPTWIPTILIFVGGSLIGFGVTEARRGWKEMDKYFHQRNDNEQQG